MRRITVVCLGLAVSLLAATAVAAKSLRAERYDTAIEILPDGALRVTEVVEFRFGGGPFTHVYRSLPLRRVDDIQVESSPDPFRVERKGDAVKVRWDFEPIQDTARSFTVVYRVEGALRPEQGSARLAWNAFPDERSYKIEHATAKLTWPRDWHIVATESRPRSAFLGVDVDGARFDARRLSNESTLRIAATFTGTGPASLAAPRWQVQRANWNRNMPVVAATAGGLLLLGIAMALALARDRNRHSDVGPVSAVTPPSNLPAALAGALRYGDVGLTQAVATFVELAMRGWIDFSTVHGKRWWKSGEYSIRRLKPAADLAPFERVVMEAAFRQSEGDTVPASRAWADIAKARGKFRAAVREELRQRGELDTEAEATRKRLFALAAICIATGLAAFAFVPILWHYAGAWMFLPSAALLIAGIVALIAAGTISRLSALGQQRAAAWKSFGKHLRDLAKKGATLDAQRFQSWFPYALALGVAPAWLQAGVRGALPTPNWFQVPAGEHGMPGFAAMFAASGAATHGGGPAWTGGAAGGGGSGARSAGCFALDRPPTWC